MCKVLKSLNPKGIEMISQSLVHIEINFGIRYIAEVLKDKNTL